MNYVFAFITAYLLGSISIGILLGRSRYKTDVRSQGSGNAGATNVARVFGMNAGLMTFLGDAVKTFIALFVGKLFAGDMGVVIAGIGCLIGHCWPIFFGFKGGKGVSIGLGVMIVLLPYETLLALGIFILTILLTRYVSVGSMLAGISLFVIVALEKYWISYNVAQIYFYLTLLLAILVIITHRQNIGRLLSGTENRLKFKSDAGKAGSNA